MGRQNHQWGAGTDGSGSLESAEIESARRFLAEAEIPEGGFLVGEWLVEPALNSITRFKKTVRIEPKIMDLLVYLAQHAGRVVAKERLMATLWADVFVTDDVLTRGVSELRRAFGDSWQKPRFIQTIPRRGYRLVAAVKRAGDDGVCRRKSRSGLWAAALQILAEYWRTWAFVAAGARVILAGLLGQSRQN